MKRLSENLREEVSRLARSHSTAAFVCLCTEIAVAGPIARHERASSWPALSPQVLQHRARRSAREHTQCAFLIHLQGVALLDAGRPALTTLAPVEGPLLALAPVGEDAHSTLTVGIGACTKQPAPATGGKRECGVTAWAATPPGQKASGETNAWVLPYTTRETPIRYNRSTPSPAPP